MYGLSLEKLENIIQIRLEEVGLTTFGHFWDLYILLN